MPEFSELISSNRHVLMGFSMISIMLYHQQWFVDGVFFSWVQMLGYIGVEVFLLLSGFGLAHSLKKNDICTFYYNRIVRLMPACLIYGVIKLSVSHLSFMPHSDAFFLWDLLSLSHWYIYAIVVYYIISPVLFYLINKYGWWVLFSVIVFSYIILLLWRDNSDVNYFLKYGRWIIKRFPVFILGMTIALKSIRLRPLAYCGLGLLFMLLNLFALHYIIAANAHPETTAIPAKFFVMLPNRTDVPDNGRYLLDMLCVFFFVPLFVLFGQILRFIRLLPAIIWIGMYSLEFYLCHQYIFSAYNEGLRSSKIVEFSAAITTVIVVAYIIKETSKRSLRIIAFINKN